IIAQPGPSYAEYVTRRKDMDARVQDMMQKNLMLVFGDYQKLGAVYLQATALTEGERPAFLKKHNAPAEPLPNWVKFIRGRSKPSVAIVGVWNALVRVQPARFSIQGPRVLSNQYEKDRAALLSPVVLKAFRGKSPRSLADVAAVYAQLFARTDDEWNAA